jgi:ABC-type branched-subunit amino acid transport system substrate-binding protein
MITEKKIKIISLISLLFIFACSPSYDESKTKRIETAMNNENQETILIGVAWADKDHSFVKGALLAMKEFNQNGVLGKSIELVINEGEKKISNDLTLRQKQNITVEVARSFAANPRLVAVTGHRSSYQAIPASIVYQFHGIAFIAPTSTNLNLTDHNFNYVFRMTPNNEEIAKQLATYCHKKGYKKMVILHSKSPYGTELADSFFSSFVENKNKKGDKTEIVLRRSFFSTKTDFSDLMVELKQAKKEHEFDAIFIATGAKMAATIYQDTRDMGILTPFIGADGLDNLRFWEAVKEWEISEKAFAKKSVVPTVFNTRSKMPISQKFIKNFKKEYELEADRYAALGYDSIKLLVHAIKKAKSIQPFKITETLRYMPPCQGVTGQYLFKRDGDVVPRKFSFKFFQKGQFDYEEIRAKSIAFDQDWFFNRKIVWDCANIDMDQDGIANDIDACPDENPDDIARIDKQRDLYQTGLLRGCLIDEDYDKVPDFRDACLNNTSVEIVKGVDAQGCPVDHDKDAVPDYRDNCPKNKRFEIRIKVDSEGCPIDTDKDKIPDYQDVCPRDTLQERSKGIYQQGEQIGCPIDSDNDNIPDYIDDCPKNLPNEIEKGLDLAGCPLDRDKDSVPDYLDKCPLNKHFEIKKGVDSQGCPVDSDQDTIPDYKDVCLKNTAKEISKGVFQAGRLLGCPIDHDRDGVSDYRDECLNNPPVAIGKGVDSEGCPIDTDKDQVPDYKDICFNNTPKQIVKGVYQQGHRLGCPIDNDMDGVPDYRDVCPNNTRFDIRKGVDARGCPLKKTFK